ncbi:hypothetical protein [Pseudomonas mosselii]|uniref:Phage protein n=1 Tax=Pseudomonas putida TaxID=303 RepID=A0A0N9MHI5_PSEPU|nr:hypothetical protein [Pseudomonas mosselii]ALG76520.1 hypothetical protein [Pseudomonas putida]KXG81685.1 hypothetical protein AXZ07_16240 [Pseudomonas mosselii]
MSELAQLYAAVTSTLRATLPVFATVATEGDVTLEPALPALVHGVLRMRGDEALRDGRSLLMATFEARVTAQGTPAQARTQAGVLAAQLIDVLRQQSWGLDYVEGARDILAEAEGTSWRVQWEQPVLLGTVHWPWPDQPPGSLMLGFAPDTGPGNQDKYLSPEDLA